MNELEKKAIIEKVEIANQSKPEKTFIGRVKPKPNHHVFEVNLETKTIKKAVFDKEITFREIKGQGLRKKITINKNCVYISALNVKNVYKILKREYGL